MGNVSSASAKPSGSAAEEDSKPSATAARAPRNMTIREWKEEGRFLMFTRVLMKYLEQHDATMHAKAKAIIEDYLETSIEAGQTYQDLISSTKVQLHLAVGEVHWKNAYDYLTQHLMDMAKSNKKKKASGWAKVVKKKGGSAKAAAPGAKK